ncbi:hypothetical protein EDC01DRAFT_673535 [Geopyxis carbonaria]|nr:hypothetical protein EDC01DRAFT_673535 [Geopyxis carbonaria]
MDIAARSKRLQSVLSTKVHNLTKLKRNEAFADQVRKISEEVKQGNGDRDNAFQEMLAMLNKMDETHKEESTVRRAVETMGPFVDGINRFTGVVDTMVQFDPSPAALIWGSARMFLQVVSEYNADYDTISKHTQGLTRVLMSIGSLHQTFDRSDIVLNALEDTYGLILQYFAAVSRAYTTRGSVLAVKSLFRTRTISNCKKTINEIEGMLKSARELSDDAEKAVRKRRDRDVLLNSWLKIGAPEIQMEYKKMKDLRLEETCEWLLRDPTFENWEAFNPTQSTPRGQSILWLHGKPGNGKSVLASAVVQSLQESTEARQVVYFFFDDKSGIIEFLRALIRQLITIIDFKGTKLPQKFNKILDECGGVGLCDRHVAVQALISLLDVCNRVHVVVDGLDECTDRMIMSDNNYLPQSRLTSTLSDLTGYQFIGIVKWFFTSCPEPDIKDFFEAAQVIEIELTRQRVADDVKKYMNTRLKSYKVSKSDFLSLIHGGIQVVEDGGFNFLDAKITFNLLDRNGPAITHKDIPELLKSYAAYGKAARGVGFNSRYLRGLIALKNKSDRELEMASRIVAFVSVAKVNLKRSELIQALSSSFCNERPDEDHDAMITAKFKELCVPLVEFDMSSDPNDPTIYMAHRTACEFLNQNPDEIDGLKDHKSLRSFFIPIEERHQALGIACLKYFLYFLQSKKLDEKFKDEVNAGTTKYAFLCYASICWFNHIQYKESVEVAQLIESFLKSAQLLICCWSQLQLTPWRFAPWNFARLTPHVFQYRINKPESEVYPSLGRELADYCHVAPIPSWFRHYKKDLFEQFLALVSEFGLVFLRRRGGIKHYCPALLGAEVMLAHYGPRHERWKYTVLLGSREVCAPKDLPKTGWGFTIPRHQILLRYTKQHIYATTVAIASSSSECVLFYFNKWEVTMTDKEIGPRLAWRSGWTAACDTGGNRVCFPGVIGGIPSDFFVVPHGNHFYISPGFGASDIFHGEPQNGKLCPLGINNPSSLYAPRAEKDPVGLLSCFHGRQMAINNEVVLVASRWFLSTPERCPLHVSHQLSRRTTAEENPAPADRDGPFAESNSESESDDESGLIAAASNNSIAESAGGSWRLGKIPPGEDSESGKKNDDSDSGDSSSNPSDSGPYASDSGYSSTHSAAQLAEQELKTGQPAITAGVRTVLTCKVAGGEPSELVFSSRTDPPLLDPPLLDSPPVLHPSKRLFVLPIDSERTLVSSYDISESPLQFQHNTWCNHRCAHSKMYKFNSSGDTLFEVVARTARTDGVEYLTWHIDLFEHQIDTEKALIESAGINTVSRTSISWLPPYDIPFEKFYHLNLPFFLSWSKKYLYIIFGACEIYICRIDLTGPPTAGSPAAEDSDSDSRTELPRMVYMEDTPYPHRRVEYLREPAFLPASTVERPFTFHVQHLWNREYAVFGLAAHAQLPAAIVWKEVETDLGGWAPYDDATTFFGMTYQDKLENTRAKTWPDSSDSWCFSARDIDDWTFNNLDNRGTPQRILDELTAYGPRQTW